MTVDIKNAFNSVHRGEEPCSKEVHDQCLAYTITSGNATRLHQRYFLKTTILTLQFVNFSMANPWDRLAINSIIKSLNSKFNVWYLDDSSLGDKAEIVINDLVT